MIERIGYGCVVGVHIVSNVYTGVPFVFAGAISNYFMIRL